MPPLLPRSVAELGNRCAKASERGSRLEASRKLEAAGIDDAIEDPGITKSAACIENRAGRAIDGLRKGSETLRAGYRYEVLARGIVTVSRDPYRFRHVAMVATWQRPSLHSVHQIGHTAALPIKGVGRYSGRKLALSEHAAHCDHIDGRGTGDE